MTNKEKYQRAFSALHASDDCIMEVKAMESNNNKRIHISRLAAICAAAALILALAAAAYAADVGGIRRGIQLWLHGDRTDAVIEISDGSYTLTYEDAEGNTHEQSGGGIAYGPDGTERPLTADELIEELYHPDVEYLDDGTVWVYYYGQAVEITDKFDDDGVCYVQLKDGDDILYMTIKYDNGFSTSNSGYPNPWSFN